jgi:hypothetical protein
VQRKATAGVFFLLLLFFFFNGYEEIKEWLASYELASRLFLLLEEEALQLVEPCNSSGPVSF